MKNQYHADERDFYKYDLLLALVRRGLGFRCLVMVWWLTHLPRVQCEVFHASALERLRTEAGAQHATWISPDNLVAYFVIAKSDDRLREIVAALEPYLTLNAFHLPHGGIA